MSPTGEAAAVKDSAPWYNFSTMRLFSWLPKRTIPRHWFIRRRTNTDRTAPVGHQNRASITSNKPVLSHTNVYDNNQGRCFVHGVSFFAAFMHTTLNMISSPGVKTDRPHDTPAIVCFTRDSAQHVHTVPCRSTSRWLLQGGTTGRTPSRSCKRAVCCCCKYIVHSISEGGISLSLSFALV